MGYCIARGYRIVGIVKEVGSGVNDSRALLIKVLKRDDYNLIVCEHKDRLTRVGFNYIKVLLNSQGKDVEVINEAREEREDLMQDFISIITSFCARIYGLRSVTAPFGLKSKGTHQAVSKKALKLGLIQPSGTNLSIPTKQNKIDEVRIIPSGGSYVIEVVYEIEFAKPAEIKEHKAIAGIDLGINNLATVTSNILDFQPFIVCGKALKSANRYYNKTKARLQSSLPKNQRTSNRIARVTQKRSGQSGLLSPHG